MSDLDPSIYLRAPVLNVSAGVALGIALLSAMPKGLPPVVRRTAKQLRATVVDLQTRWAEQRAATSQNRTSVRPADLRLDRAWAAVGRRLRDLADLAETMPEGAVAARLSARLFPRGLEFLKLPFDRQWAESDQLVRLLDEPQVRTELEPLVGDFLLAEVVEAHRIYGEALGITTAKVPVDSPVGIIEALRAVQQAISAHALQIVAAAAADPQLLRLAKQALRPLDDFRAANARRAAGASRPPEDEPEFVSPEPTDADVSPSTPVPELEDANV